MPRAWVIEDNELNFELVEFLLGEAGWTIERARDDAGFDELLAGDPPDVVLLDMNLPESSGIELLGRLRAHPRHASAPVLALTAHAMQGDRQRFLDAGCDAYVPKPIDRETLFREIAAVTERERS